MIGRKDGLRCQYYLLEEKLPRYLYIQARIRIVFGKIKEEPLRCRRINKDNVCKRKRFFCAQIQRRMIYHHDLAIAWPTGISIS